VEQSVQPWSFARKGEAGWRARGERGDGRE
jgi:hypothetical protein